MFLLDTDHLGIMQRQTEPEFSRLRSRMGQHPPSLFFVSIVSFHEQVTGWNAYLNRSRGTAGVVRAYQMFQRILADFSVAQTLPFDQAAADVFASLLAQRVRAGTM